MYNTAIIFQHADISIGNNIRPSQDQGAVGKGGIDKNIPFERVVKIAYETKDDSGRRPNVIIKAGINAKWYLKFCPEEKLDDRISKWRNSKSGIEKKKMKVPPTLYFIQWNEENPRVTEQPNIEEEEKRIDVTRCRDMTKCFTDGQRIRHKGNKTQTTWIGTYDSTKGKIIYDGNSYTLNMFVVTHYKTERPDRTPNANAWAECECEKDGEWVSTFSLHA